MAEPFDAALPPAIALTGSYTIRLTALDPTSGDKVAGVTVSNLAMYIDNIGEGGVSDLGVGPYMVVPGPGA